MRLIINNFGLQSRWSK